MTPEDSSLVRESRPLVKPGYGGFDRCRVRAIEEDEDIPALGESLAVSIRIRPEIQPGRRLRRRNLDPYPDEVRPGAVPEAYKRPCHLGTSSAELDTLCGEGLFDLLNAVAAATRAAASKAEEEGYSEDDQQRPHADYRFERTQNSPPRASTLAWASVPE